MTEQKNKKKANNVLFDEDLRILVKAGHIEQGRGKKAKAEKAMPKPEKQGG
jgi:hypothetical protein